MSIHIPTCKTYCKQCADVRLHVQEGLEREDVGAASAKDQDICHSPKGQSNPTNSGQLGRPLSAACLHPPTQVTCVNPPLAHHQISLPYSCANSTPRIHPRFPVPAVAPPGVCCALPPTHTFFFPAVRTPFNVGEHSQRAKATAPHAVQPKVGVLLHPQHSSSPPASTFVGFTSWPAPQLVAHTITTHWPAFTSSDEYWVIKTPKVKPFDCQDWRIRVVESPALSVLR